MTARVDYGIDAPGLLRAFVLAGSGLLLTAIVLVNIVSSWWGPWLAVPVFLVAGYALGMSLLMLWGSRMGKVRGREAILDLHAWRGDEQVLDIGCGRGLMLVGAAKRLTTGQVTGIDLWLDRDQATNSADAARRNAVAEGVADRVTVATADMRDLPFADRSFDVILSHWAVHNLPDAADRAEALAEMVRVVRPGGTIALTDIAQRDEYLEILRRSGLRDVRLVVASRTLDVVYGTLSFGSYRPATIVCRASAA